jgi:hypothetical protein
VSCKELTRHIKFCKHNKWSQDLHGKFVWFCLSWLSMKLSEQSMKLSQYSHITSPPLCCQHPSRWFSWLLDSLMFLFCASVFKLQIISCLLGLYNNRVVPVFTLSLGLLSPLISSFSGICKVKRFYWISQHEMLQLSTKCSNSAFHARASRLTIVVVQIGAVKLYM